MSHLRQKVLLDHNSFNYNGSDLRSFKYLLCALTFKIVWTGSPTHPNLDRRGNGSGRETLPTLVCLPWRKILNVFFFDTLDPRRKTLCLKFIFLLTKVNLTRYVPLPTFYIVRQMILYDSFINYIFLSPSPWLLLWHRFSFYYTEIRSILSTLVWI